MAIAAQNVHCKHQRDCLDVKIKSLVNKQLRMEIESQHTERRGQVHTGKMRQIGNKE